MRDQDDLEKEMKSSEDDVSIKRVVTSCECDVQKAFF